MTVEKDGSGEVKLGYVGLGAMGGALARRLMLTHTLRVFDIRPEAVGEFAEEGAIAAQDGASLARESDVILLCLPRSSDVRDAIFGAGGVAEGLAPGKILIDQTTGDPDETRAMAAKLAESGVTMIDAPVSGGIAGAEAGTIAIMVGGPPDVVAQVGSVFDSISPNIFHCGDIGSGHVMKLVNNTLGACCRLATLETVAMGRKYGLSLEKMTEVLNKSSGRNNYTESLLPKMIEGKKSSSFAMSLSLKDVSLGTKLGMECGAPMMIANLARGLLQQGVHKFGEEVSLDEAATLIGEMADMTFTD